MNPDLFFLPLSLLEFMEYTYRISRADTELENFQSILNSTDGLLSRIASTHSSTDEWVVGEIRNAQSAVERGKALVERVTAARKAQGGRLGSWRWGWVLRDREAVEGMKGVLLQSHVTLLHISAQWRAQGWVEEPNEEEFRFGWPEEVPSSTGTSAPSTDSRYLPKHSGTSSSTSSTGSRGYRLFEESLGKPIEPPSLRDAWLLQKEIERTRFDMSL
ncbi:MAG: hypothetical protein M1840_002587 [Geoglossum simile]|nr:MAG: hypothetical protein M1840_002587 [Geoglossum simile]